MFRTIISFPRRLVSSGQITKFVWPQVITIKRHNHRSIVHRKGYSAFTGLLGLSLIKSKVEDQSRLAIEKADKLFDESKFPELLEHLTEQKLWDENGELLWRVARCKFHLSKKDIKNKDKLIRESLTLVNKALELNEKCGSAHKWAAIILDAASALDGTRARIEQTMNVRKHMEEAINLMPNDGTSYYLLGEWHYSVAMTSWVEKKIASVVFATLPDADLEVALKMFQKAEEVEPGFYSKNLVLMAKTLITLKRDEEIAKNHLLKVVQLYKTSDKWDDVEAVTEAKLLLKNMGVKVQ